MFVGVPSSAPFDSRLDPLGKFSEKPEERKKGEPSPSDKAAEVSTAFAAESALEVKSCERTRNWKSRTKEWMKEGLEPETLLRRALEGGVESIFCKLAPRTTSFALACEKAIPWIDDHSAFLRQWQQVLQKGESGGELPDFSMAVSPQEVSSLVRLIGSTTQAARQTIVLQVKKLLNRAWENVQGYRLTDQSLFFCDLGEGPLAQTIAHIVQKRHPRGGYKPAIDWRSELASPWIADALEERMQECWRGECEEQDGLVELLMPTEWKDSFSQMQALVAEQRAERRQQRSEREWASMAAGMQALTSGARQVGMIQLAQAAQMAAWVCQGGQAVSQLSAATTALSALGPAASLAGTVMTVIGWVCGLGQRQDSSLVEFLQQQFKHLAWMIEQVHQQIHQMRQEMHEQFRDVKQILGQTLERLHDFERLSVREFAAVKNQLRAQCEQLREQLEQTARHQNVQLEALVVQPLEDVCFRLEHWTQSDSATLPSRETLNENLLQLQQWMVQPRSEELFTGRFWARRTTTAPALADFLQRASDDQFLGFCLELARQEKLSAHLPERIMNLELTARVARCVERCHSLATQQQIWLDPDQALRRQVLHGLKGTQEAEKQIRGLVPSLIRYAHQRWIEPALGQRAALVSTAAHEIGCELVEQRRRERIERWEAAVRPFLQTPRWCVGVTEYMASKPDLPAHVMLEAESGYFLYDVFYTGQPCVHDSVLQECQRPLPATAFLNGGEFENEELAIELFTDPWAIFRRSGSLHPLAEAVGCESIFPLTPSLRQQLFEKIDSIWLKAAAFGLGHFEVEAHLSASHADLNEQGHDANHLADHRWHGCHKGISSTACGYDSHGRHTFVELKVHFLFDRNRGGRRVHLRTRHASLGHLETWAPDFYRHTWNPGLWDRHALAAAIQSCATHAFIPGSKDLRNVRWHVAMEAAGCQPRRHDWDKVLDPAELRQAGATSVVRQCQVAMEAQRSRVIERILAGTAQKAWYDHLQSIEIGLRLAQRLRTWSGKTVPLQLNLVRLDMSPKQSHPLSRVPDLESGIEYAASGNAWMTFQLGADGHLAQEESVVPKGSAVALLIEQQRFQGQALAQERRNTLILSRALLQQKVSALLLLAAQDRRVKAIEEGLQEFEAQTSALFEAAKELDTLSAWALDEEGLVDRSQLQALSRIEEALQQIDQHVLAFQARWQFGQPIADQAAAATVSGPFVEGNTEDDFLVQQVIEVRRKNEELRTEMAALRQQMVLAQDQAREQNELLMKQLAQALQAMATLQTQVGVLTAALSK